MLKPVALLALSSVTALATVTTELEFKGTYKVDGQLRNVQTSSRFILDEMSPKEVILFGDAGSDSHQFLVKLSQKQDGNFLYSFRWVDTKDGGDKPLQKGLTIAAPLTGPVELLIDDAQAATSLRVVVKKMKIDAK